MLKLFIITVLLFFVVVSQAFPTRPSPELTPGHLCSEFDEDFYGYRYQEEIAYCERAVSESDKRKIYEAYGVKEDCRQLYTVDHLIPLALGGSNSLKNLWPEPKVIKRQRQALEYQLYLLLKNQKISQSRAVKIVLSEKTKIQRQVPFPKYCQ